MAEIVVHKLYEEKERQYIIDAYEKMERGTDENPELPEKIS